MSNFTKDLQNAEKVGQEAYEHYQTNQKLGSDDLTKVGQAAQQLAGDFQGSGQSGAEGALGAFAKTDVGREIETNVAKQAIKSEAENALKSGSFGGIAEQVDDQLHKN